MTRYCREAAPLQVPSRPRRVTVLLLPDVHLQDMAGPVQVLYEAAHLGGAYELSYCGAERAVRSAQGLLLSDLAPLPELHEFDIALALVERNWGPLVAARVAREMVVYLRRNGEHDQRSVYLDHRLHLHPGVHRVQDWLVANPHEKPVLSRLARIAAMSPRHLARVFRRATGVTTHRSRRSS